MVAWRGKMAKDGARALFWICLGRRQRFISVGYFRKRTLCLSSAHSVDKGASFLCSFSPNGRVDACGANCIRGRLELKSLI